MRVNAAFLLFFLLIGIVSPISALQDVPDPSLPAPIFSGSHASNVSWAWDSSSLVFQPFDSGRGVVVGDLSWMQYDLGTEQLTASNRWQFQTELSAEEQETFDPSDGLILSSPSGRYIFFVEEDTHLMSLGDRLTGEVFNTYYGNSSRGTDGFHAQWSEDETALAFETYPSAGGADLLYFYLNFEQGVSQTLLDELRTVTLNDTLYGLGKVHDISADGDRLFIQIMVANPEIPYEQREQSLLIWNSKDPASSQLIPDIHEFSGAAFAPGDESRVLIVSDMGLVEYDRINQSSTMLDSRINTSWAYGARFSPDGKWIALKDSPSASWERGNYLYVVSSGVPEAIFSGKCVRNLAWSADSNGLVFQPFDAEQGVEVSDQSWTSYDVDSGRLTTDSTWGLQLDLREGEIEWYEKDVGVFEGSSISYMMLSPREDHTVDNYVFFAWQGDPGGFFSISDVPSREVKTAYYPNLSGTNVFTTRWSEHQNAFVVTTHDDQGRPAGVYGAGLRHGIDFVTLQQLPSLAMNGQTYQLREPFDIAASGDAVIASADYYLEYPLVSEFATIHRQALVLWKSQPYYPRRSSVIPNIREFEAAAFAPGDENKVLVVTDRGLVMVNLVTQRVIVLDDRIHTARVDEAVFSPDGNWIAFTEHRGESCLEGNALYVLPTFLADVPALLSGYAAQNVSWAADSGSLVFQPSSSEGATEVTDLGWKQYDITTEQVTPSNQWQFQTELSAEELETFAPVEGFYERSSLILASPSGRYIVFGHGEDELVTLADRQTGVVYHSSYPGYFRWVIDSFDVQWSEDETALVFRMMQSNQQYQYTYLNFEQRVTDAQLDDLLPMTFGNATYDLETVFDISADGDRLLVQLREQIHYEGFRGEPETPLLIWNRNDPSTSQIIPYFHEMSGAVFAPDDEGKLLIVSDIGLVEYEIDTQIVTVLNPRINTAWVDRAIFSPDGRSIALMELYEDRSSFPRNNRDNNLYVVSSGYLAE